MHRPALRILLPVFLAGFLSLAAVFALARLGGSTPSNAGIAEGVAALDAFDYPAAHAIFARLAEKNDPAAESWLGHMAEEGLGSAPDGAQATHWYRKAADTGSAEAERRLGELYLHGTTVPQDAVQARHWLALAAAQKDVRAERELGDLYAQGIGGARDPARAYGWLALAASQGDLGAARARDRIAPLLTAEAAHQAITTVSADLNQTAPHPDAAAKVAERVPPRPAPAPAG